jgi:hypothetical protein
MPPGGYALWRSQLLLRVFSFSSLNNKARPSGEGADSGGRECEELDTRTTLIPPPSTPRQALGALGGGASTLARS